MMPPSSASRIASLKNCVRMLPFVAPRARRRPISERRSSTPMIMMFATPTAPTRSATAASPRKRSLNAPWASARATSAEEGWLTSTLLGASGSGRCGKDVVDGVDLAGLRADVDLGRVTVEVEVALGGGKADQGAAVDLGREGRRTEDAGDVEPHPAQRDPLAGKHTVDAEPLRGRGAEHADRLPLGRGVEEAALPDARARPRAADRGWPRRSRCVGVDRRDQRRCDRRCR